SAAASSVWAHGIPRGKPAVVTLEHALTDPPRLIGLASADHPGIAANSAAFTKSGMKRLETVEMDSLLERLESQGFLHDAAPIDALAPLKPAVELRRLAICIDGVTCALTIPRHPPVELAARFNELSHSVMQVFNVTVDLHQDPSIHDPD